jgi:hypothetical protein
MNRSNRDPDDVTAAIHRRGDAPLGDQHDAFVGAAARRILERTEVSFGPPETLDVVPDR